MQYKTVTVGETMKKTVKEGTFVVQANTTLASVHRQCAAASSFHFPLFFSELREKIDFVIQSKHEIILHRMIQNEWWFIRIDFHRNQIELVLFQRNVFCLMT